MAVNPSEKKLHIVHTESSLGWGGQEIRILSEARGFIERGHRLTIITPSTSNIYHAAIKAGIATVALPIEKKRLKGMFAIRKWLAQNKPDVVVTHSSTDSWLVALSQWFASPIPMVRTRHLSASVPDNRASRWLYSQASAHVATTGESIRQALIDHVHVDPDRVTAVPTGMDAQRFVPGDKKLSRASLGLSEADLIIGIVATIRSWKGHQYLLEAVSKLKHNSVRLLVVGDGPARKALEQRIDELNLGSRVIMAGQQEDVLPWLQAMDIFVLPSYANEGVPQALLQAMLCEKAIITTDAGSISEAVEHQHSALLVDKKNSDAIAQALELFISDPALAKRLGKQARVSAAAEHGYEAMLDKMEKIFYQVISRE